LWTTISQETLPDGIKRLFTFFALVQSVKEFAKVNIPVLFVFSKPLILKEIFFAFQFGILLKTA